MKVNVVMSAIGAALALLLGYLCFCVADGKENAILCAIGSVVCFIATLVPAFGFKFESGRMGVNVKIVSLLYFGAFFVSNLIFGFAGVNPPPYIIVNGLLLLLYLATFYKMQGIKNV